MIEKTQWVRRPRGMECPICKRTSWCTISADGTLARCMRVQSDRPATSKNGEPAWVHEIGGCALASPLELPKKPKEKLPQQVVEAIARRAYSHHRAPAARESLSRKLGLSVKSLEAMRVGFGVDEWSGQEWTSWPSRDWTGKIVGISRRYADGSKKSMAGTSPGLYFPICGRLASIPVLIVEGGSDVAAAYMMGFLAVGRFSNTGGAGLIRRMNLRQVIVIGERDSDPSKRGEFPHCPKDCKGCSHCFPGEFGARNVAAQLGCRWMMPPEGCKDLRQVVNQHRVRDFLEQLAGTQQHG